MDFLKDDDNITAEDVFHKLGLMKWKISSPEEKDICDRYLIKLAQENGLQWIEDNKYQIVNDFEDQSEERKRQKQIYDERQRRRARQKQHREMAGKGLMGKLFKGRKK